MRPSHFPRHIDELVCRDDATPRRLYALQDANFNVTALVSATGAMQERFLYDPYGVDQALSNAWTPTTEAYAWMSRFQAGRYENATRLTHFRTRDLHTLLGRWLNRDSLGYVDGQNLYDFVSANPVNAVDPFGIVSAYIILFYGEFYTGYLLSKMPGEKDFQRSGWGDQDKWQASWSFGVKVEGTAIDDPAVPGKLIFTTPVDGDAVNVSGTTGDLDVTAIIKNAVSSGGQPYYKTRQEPALQLGRRRDYEPKDPTKCVECRWFEVTVDFAEKKKSDIGKLFVEKALPEIIGAIPGESLLAKAAVKVGKAGAEFLAKRALGDKGKQLVRFVLVICADDKAFVGVYNIPSN